jgi:uncharacterized membrane protein YccF (DUF307 family)
MKFIGNIIWLIFAGIPLAIGYLTAAVIMFITIIGIPFGLQSLKIAVFALWPFGRTVVKRDDSGAASAIGNILWFIFAGWWLAIGHLVTSVLLFITIIGIPLAIGNLKMIPISLTPFGRAIVDIDDLSAGTAGAVAIGS